MTKIGALVPARIGSKRLPKKNIRILGNKPLICWTIDVLLESDIFYDITVSTESDEIADVVRQYYSEKEVKILKRPEELAQDDSPMRDVIFHYLEHRSDLDWYGVFLPTFPFRDKYKIREAAYHIYSHHVIRVVSASDWEESLMDYYYPVNKGVKRFFHEPSLHCRIGIPVYEFKHKNVDDEIWIKYGLTITEKEYIIHVNRKEAIDIDTIEDFELASLLTEGKNIYVKKPKVYYYDGWEIILPEDVNFDKFIDYIGKEKLKEKEYPILILETPKYPLNFLRIQDGSIRRYYMRPNILKFLYNEKVKKTQNMQYIPTHYKQSTFYRMLRKASPTNKNFPLTHDMDGQQFGLDDQLIPYSRIIFLEEIKTCDFYSSPFLIK